MRTSQANSQAATQPVGRALHDRPDRLHPRDRLRGEWPGRHIGNAGRLGLERAGLFGVGPVVTAAVVGDVRHASRFPSRNHFAAYNGTAPIEVSSGGRKIYRLSRRGNRRLNHAIHMAAVTQIRNPGSEGRACFEKKLADGKTRKEALRAPKRQISDAIFACLQAGARRAEGPGGQPGNHCSSRAAGSRAERQRFGQATPGPGPHPTAGPHPGQGWAFPDCCHIAAGDTAGPGGAPAAKRGRTTWRCGEAAAILGHKEGRGHTILCHATAPEGHLTPREKD